MNNLHNYSFSQHFSDVELEQLSQLLTLKTFEAGEFIIKEHDINDDIFFLEQGTVIVSKGIHGKQHRLLELQPYEIFGELAFFDTGKRSSSVQAKDRVTVLVMEKSNIERLAPNLKYLHYKFSSQLSAIKLRDNYQRVANEVLLRVKFGKFVNAIILGFCLFISFLEFYNDLLAYASYYAIGAVAFSIGGLLCIYIIKHMHEPLSAFGVTFNNWQKSAIEGIVVSAVCITLAKLIWPEINFTDNIYSISYLGFYIALSYLQEFIFRGVTITAFEKFYNSTPAAIVITSFLFAVLHIHIGLVVFILSFFMALLLGIMFVRHKNLLGVTITHTVLGNLATTTGIMQQYSN